ncbi:hypothetical protein LMH87_000186 [Akanthomyces muscarius]|uniref:Uncharacterized protein n=1 Tax=Akanthomyces muscarius TaxID=2231603 RepID=A0A9W8QEJ2_AKAMU|nr:hypothetical protein LMH87_000186 [Akanthomyces muscarius]KAJ4154915.1 hypothetical protein LMH87_000186 [Akanthomyces muscarius]
MDEPPPDEFSSMEQVVFLPSADQTSAESQATSPKLPAPAASANEVRAYLRDLLITKHNLRNDFAESVSRSWKIGRGWTLRSSPVSAFTKRFGAELGPQLYWAVRHEKKAETWAKEAEAFRLWRASGKACDDQCNTGLSLLTAGLMLLLSQNVTLALFIIAVPQLFLSAALPTANVQGVVRVAAICSLCYVFDVFGKRKSG